MAADFQTRRFFTYLFIAAIAVVFVLQFGPGSKGCESPLRSQASSAAASVNGKEISALEFRKRYVSQIRAYQEQSPSFTEALARQMGMPQQILEGLVNRELLAQAAERQSVLVSDAELRQLIHKLPYFQRDGKFDYGHYSDVVRNNFQQTIPQYEDALRRELSIDKLLTVVQQGAMISDEEVKARYFHEGNRAKATFVRFLPTMFVDKVPAAKPADIAAYLKGHTKEVSDYYTANKFLYQQGEQVKARHILIKVDKDASAEKKAEAKKKVEALRKELVGGKDFATLAQSASEDTSTRLSGGDLGYNERANWVPEFSKVAFSLKPGELSEPVETPFGFHLIKVEGKKAAESKALKDVQSDIAAQLLKKSKAKELARAEAEKALKGLKDGKTLAVLYPPSKEAQSASHRFEAESKPESVDTGEFNSVADAVPLLGPAPELTTDVFAADKAGPLSKVYSVGDGVAVAQVTERKRPTDSSFTTEREKLRADAIRAKQLELREAYIKAVRKEASVTTNVQSLDRDLQQQEEG